MSASLSPPIAQNKTEVNNLIPSPRIRDLSLAPDNYVSHGATRELMLIVALAGILLGSLGGVLQSSPDASDR